MSFIITVIVVGLANYAFRFLPIKLAANRVQHVGGPFGAALGALGAGAIAALFVLGASDFYPQAWLPATAGFGAVAVLMWRTKNVAVATIVGALVYALVRLV